MVRKYSWVDYGSSYGLSEINAAFLYSQLKQAKKITKKRINIFNNYHQQLKNLEIKNLIKRPTIPNYAKSNGHIYYVLGKNNKRDKLIKYLQQNKISTVFHYVPLHSSSFGNLKGIAKFKMENTNYISHNLLRLPMHNEITDKNVDKICEKIQLFYKN